MKPSGLLYDFPLQSYYSLNYRQFFIYWFGCTFICQTVRCFNFAAAKWRMFNFEKFKIPLINKIHITCNMICKIHETRWTF